MSIFPKKTLIILVCSLLAPTGFAERSIDLVTSSPDQPQQGGGGGGIEKLIQYLKNLGLHLGFDVTKAPSPAPKTGLLNLNQSKISSSAILDSFLGSIPVYMDGSGNASGPFMPSDIPQGLSTVNPSINQLANSTFSQRPNTPYDTPKAGQITANPLLDQKQFQKDPVSQSILNILGTPNSTFCPQDNKECPYLSDGTIVNNVIGDVPGSIYDYTFNQNVIGQLNSNSLIAPLMYSYTALQTQNNNNVKNKGLTASNQAEQAANFVRYASSELLPLRTPTKKAITDLEMSILQAGKDTPSQKNLLSNFNSYLANLRVYVAQRSVAMSNLYSMMSQRIPQFNNNSDSKSELTSAALSEYKMAAWRLKDISNPEANADSKAWLEQIDKASSATVQKEIAVLLAEINYQMYLTRQQQERILLTNTMILMQTMKDREPTLDKAMIQNQVNNASPKL